MRKPTAYGGLLVTTYLPSEVRLLGCWWWGGGEILVGPQWGETVCCPPCSSALPSNLGTAAYVMATTAAVRAFMLVIVLQVVRTGR